MQAVQDILISVGSTSSTIDKQNILYKNAANRRLREILKFIFNPYFKTHISTAKLDKAPIYSAYPIPSTPEEMMQYLVEHATGDRETCGIAKTWIHADSETAWLRTAIVTQELQIGVSVTTLNKVFGSSFIPKISCMLGTPVDKVSERQQKWPYIITEKLDGVRRLLIKQHGDIKMYSRNGHEDTGLFEIIEEAKHLPDNYVYDGELLADGDFKDSIAQRQATNSIANKKGQRSGLTFNVFDMVPVNEFFNGRSFNGTNIRKSMLAAVLQDPTGIMVHPDPEQYMQYMMAMYENFDFKVIKSVPILGIAHCMEDVEPIVSTIWDAGREGVMLNAFTAPYENKRTKTLVKMKKTITYVLRIEGFVEGTNKYEDMLGSLVTEYRDCMLQVGSGFTDFERYDIWHNRDNYEGMLFEVEAFGESTNKQGLVSLNCPIFKRIIGASE